MRPTWRKPAGIAIVLAIILAWAMIVSALTPWIGACPPLVQAALYAVAGLVWIAPLKPLLRWMETGRWRA